MREKSLLQLFLILNVALGGAFVAYLFFSARSQPEVVATRFPPPASVSSNPVPRSAARISAPVPAALPPPVAATTAVVTATIAQVASNAPPPAVKASPQTFTWREVESDAYQTYINNLRLSGCPEDKIKYVVLADINELFAQKRLALAMARDVPWWQAEANVSLVPVYPAADPLGPLEEQRRNLVARRLGPAVADAEKNEVAAGGVARLTGPVLGRLTPDRLSAVIEICQKSFDRQQNAKWESYNSNLPLNPVEEAKRREQTRVELRRILSADELEEFLLRNSQNVVAVREELRGFDATPEEFRKVFRAADAIDHAMQLEFGAPEAMSEKQRERWQRQRDGAIRDALTPERYAVYLLVKDPAYRQAQVLASQFGAPSKVVRPIYELSKSYEGRRQGILKDASLTAQQKAEEVTRLNLEQQQHIQRLVSEANARQ